MPEQVQTKIKMGVMPFLFKEEASQAFVRNFERAVECLYGCDAHYPYKVFLEIDSRCNPVDYTLGYNLEEIQTAFEIHIHACWQTIPQEVRNYVDYGCSPPNLELFLKVFNE